MQYKIEHLSGKVRGENYLIHLLIPTVAFFAVLATYFILSADRRSQALVSTQGSIYSEVLGVQELDK